MRKWNDRPDQLRAVPPRGPLGTTAPYVGSAYGAPELVDIKTQLERTTKRIVAARLIAKVIIDARQEKSMAPKPLNLPFLQGVGTALDKLVQAIEHDAQNFIEKEVQGVHAKKDAIFAKAKDRTAGARESLGQVDAFLDELDKKLTNGSPISGDSSEPPENSVG